MMITYFDLVQTGIFIYAFVGIMLHNLQRKTKIAATTANGDGQRYKALS